MTLYLIRHGLTEATGKVLLGRMTGIDLNATGREQAGNLARGWSLRRLDSIVSSPLERARQTAEPLGKKFGLPVEISEALTDIDFGEWTGRLISDLEPVQAWKQWNQFRSTVQIPCGEWMPGVQARMLNEVDRVFRVLPEGAAVALVSHADPIRTVLAHFLGMPLDLLHRIEICPASISSISLNDWGAQVLQTNLLLSPEGPALL